MAMGFTIKSSDVPVGVYVAKFVGVERTTHAEFGGGLKFEWEIIEGKYAGKSVFRTTGDKPTPRNIAGKVLSSLVGAKPTDGLSIDADNYIGRKYTVVVGETESGFTRVNEILPVEEDEPKF
jgi:hypothetical protein